MIRLTGIQKHLIDDIAEREGIYNYHLRIKVGGNSCFGSIQAVTITSRQENLQLILKTAMRFEVIRKVYPVLKAFQREIYVYEQLLPAFKNFEGELGLEDDERFSSYPKCYGCRKIRTHECLALENLTENGYKLWDCRVAMDGDHVGLVFSEYAKFHAVSIAMNIKKPALYERLTKNMRNVFGNHSEEMARVAINYAKQTVVGNARLNRGIDRLSDRLHILLDDHLQLPINKIVVIHKDGWCNNFMFKYEDENNPLKPTKVKIIDWQQAQRGHMLMDLTYFIYTCGSKAVMEHYCYYIQLYYDVLSRQLIRLGCDGELYPLTLIHYQWFKYCKFGLIMAIVMLRLMISEDNEVPSIRQLAITGADLVDRFNFRSVYDCLYFQRILDIVTVMSMQLII